MERRRVIIVTGASHGLGKEISLRFGRTGDRVLVNYCRDEKAAQGVVEEIRKNSGDAAAFRADVQKTDDVHAMISAAIKRWDRIDVLVNNAGITEDGLLLRMREDSWNTVVNTNLSGAFYCMRAVAEIMLKQGTGHIISISSIVAIQGREGQANYSASKAALIGLTKAAAREFGAGNVKVNAVLPGFLPTSMGSTVSDDYRTRIIRENVLGRVSNPGEVADFIRYLSSLENVSGQVFNLDSRII